VKTGKCIGIITTNSKSIMDKVSSKPSCFGFEPVNNVKQFSWGKYLKKDILYEVKTNTCINSTSNLQRIVGIVFVIKYNILYDFYGKLVWIKQ
jgi:hypothetical protein